MQISGTASALNGIQQAEAKFSRVAASVADPSASGDLVSLSDNAVALLQSKNAVATNINVLKTSDEIAQSTLNLLK